MELKRFSFNLRTDTATDGKNCFAGRRERVSACIAEYMPDIIGFQEARTGMREWLSVRLCELGYAMIGCGRDSNCHGEGTPVAYRRDRFEVVDAVTRWLSPTPLVPGSTYGGDQSGCPRVFTALTLKPAEGRPFIFLNTHLDHKGGTARFLGAMQITQYLSERGMPFVVTGDMNARPESDAIAVFSNFRPCGRPVTDVTAGVPCTFHAYGNRFPGTKIDYVFTDMPCDPSRSFAVPDEPVDGVYISDHYPVCAFVRTEE